MWIDYYRAAGHAAVERFTTLAGRLNVQGYLEKVGNGPAAHREWMVALFRCLKRAHRILLVCGQGIRFDVNPDLTALVLHLRVLMRPNKSVFEWIAAINALLRRSGASHQPEWCSIHHAAYEQLLILRPSPRDGRFRTRNCSSPGL